MRCRTYRAFTLVELLVVIAIIVILLALLVGGLEKALKAAERSKCGANQRGIAQASAAYALEYDRTFPVAKTIPGNVNAVSSTAVRHSYDSTPALGVPNGTQPTSAQQAAVAVGFGHLVVQGRIAGTTKAGEAIHCPSLDTTSGVPAKFGMDEASFTANTANNEASAGGSYWADVSKNNHQIHSGYYYRGLSYQVTRSGGTIRTNIAKGTFAITSDLITHVATAGARKYGRAYHHLDGWNVSFGDGHVSYIADRNGPIRIVDAASGRSNGYVEETVIGDNTQFPGPNATYPNTDNAEINGVAAPGTDEAVFNFFGRGG